MSRVLDDDAHRVGYAKLNHSAIRLDIGNVKFSCDDDGGSLNLCQTRAGAWCWTNLEIASIAKTLRILKESVEEFPTGGFVTVSDKEAVLGPILGGGLHIAFFQWRIVLLAALGKVSGPFNAGVDHRADQKKPFNHFGMLQREINGQRAA